MSRRSSRITRSTRKRPREIEEDTPDVSEEIIQEQKPRTENESKESSSPDGLVAVEGAAEEPGDDGMDVDAAMALGDGMDVVTEVSALAKSAIDRLKIIQAENKANIDKILANFPDIIEQGVDGDIFGIDISS